MKSKSSTNKFPKDRLIVSAEKGKVHRAQVDGFANGLVSVFKVGAPVRQATPRVRMTSGTLKGDLVAISRDAHRLLDGRY